MAKSGTGETEIAALRADMAALAAAIDPSEKGYVWWNHLGAAMEAPRVARVRAALRKKLPLSEDDLADLIERTVYIQNGSGGLAQHDPTEPLLKACARVLGERKAQGRLREALVALMKNLRAANASVQRLWRQADQLVR